MECDPEYKDCMQSGDNDKHNGYDNDYASRKNRGHDEFRQELLRLYLQPPGERPYANQEQYEVPKNYPNMSRHTRRT